MRKASFCHTVRVSFFSYAMGLLHLSRDFHMADPWPDNTDDFQLSYIVGGGAVAQVRDMPRVLERFYGTPEASASPGD